MNKHWTDENLVKYLDHQLSPDHCRELEIQMANDPELAARVKLISIDTAAIREAFDNTLVSAPAIDLPAISPAVKHNAALAAGYKQASANTAQDSFSRLLPLAASVVVAMGVGLFAGYGAKQYLVNAPAETTAAWQQAVVDYQVLYVPDTLPPIAPDQALTDKQLKAVSQSSGLPVAPNMVDLPGIEFRRAQTLGLKGQPLIQIAFAGPDGQPVALCFTPVDAPASEPVAQKISGMNTVSWRNGRYGFIIVGFTDPALLAAAAEEAVKLF